MKQIGCKLEVDLGTGTLEIIPLSSLGETITFSESITGFGGSEISFTLRNLDSPVKSALLRGMRQARLTLYWGTPGSTSSDVIFDGYLREARWQHDTRSADVTCQDASIKFANQRVFYTLAAFAAKMREDIVGEIAAPMGIPTGTIAAPGTNYKAINEGGDNTVLQFFADLVAPAGSRCFWRDGELNIGPAGLGTPVAVLKLADIRGPIIVTPPPTTTPNSIEFTSTLFPSLGAQGYTTDVDTVTTPGPYTPAGSVRKQDHTTGAITAHVVSPGAETNVSEVVTTIQKWGDTELEKTVDEYGWKAPLACPNQLLPTGTETVSDSFSAAVGAYPFAGTPGAPGQLLNGTGSAARFGDPPYAFAWGLAIDGSGNLYVGDWRAGAIRKITPAGVVTTLAQLTYAEGGSPFGVAVDGGGNVYAACGLGTLGYGGSTIVKVTPAGVVSVLAGAAGLFGSTDATGSAARFRDPSAVTVDGSGNVYVADTSNQTIRKITSAGVVTTLAGLAGATGSTDGTGSAARFSGPAGVVVDAAGNVYVADTGNNTIRKVTAAGVVTTIAGTAGAYGSADGTGAAARFNFPYGMGIDAGGDLYVADTNNASVRKVTPAGVVTTLESGPGPRGVAVDGSGNVYSTATDNTIRKLPPGGTETFSASQVFAGTDYALSWNPSFDVYEFGISGSGDWRTQEAETWMLLKRTLTVHAFDMSTPAKRTSSTVTVSAYAAEELTIGTPVVWSKIAYAEPWITALSPLIPYLAHGDLSPLIFYGVQSYIANDYYRGTVISPAVLTLTLADGTCWEGGAESFRDLERETITYDMVPDGHIKNDTVHVDSLMPYIWRLSGAAFDPPTVGPPAVTPPAQKYILGPAATPRWCDQLGGTLLKDYTWVVEYALDDLSYDLAHWETTTLTPVTRALANQPDTMTQFTPPSAGTVSVETPLPYPVTRTIITSDPQPGKVIATEDVLIALNGTIAGTGSSDFAETTAEMAVCGLAILRETCSPTVDFSRDPDGTIRAGDTITVDAAPLSDEAEDLLVMSSTITMNFKTSEFSQALTCLWIPPELA